MALVTILIWLSIKYTGKPNSVIAYWDGPNYVYAAITLYDIPNKNPWTNYYSYPPSYFACHLPGFPLVIRFFAFFTIGNYVLADLLAILFLGMLLCYTFRRLLIIYKCVVDPVYTTMLLSFFPLRLVIYHSVGASETLFVSLICLTFTFYKTDQYLFMLLSIWGACITRIEGMLVGAIVGLCYLLRFEIKMAFSMFLTFFSTICLLVLHRAMFNDALAYLHFNSKRQKLIHFPPFIEITPGRLSGSNVLYTHSFIDFYFLYLIGGFVLIKIAAPLAFFSLGYLAYVSFLRHIDLMRYSIPAGVFCLLIGYDALFSHIYCKKAIIYFMPFYFIYLIFYSTGQIHSNRCSDRFLNEVLEASKDHLH